MHINCACFTFADIYLLCICTRKKHTCMFMSYHFIFINKKNALFFFFLNIDFIYKIWILL